MSGARSVLQRRDPQANVETRPKLRVGFILLDKFTLNAFAGFVDALRLAADRGGRSRQIHCGWEIMGHGPVRASCGLEVSPSTAPLDPRLFDYIAVCGGNGYLDTYQPDALTAYLREADDKAVPLVGICTGTFALARAGLMRGHRACVHWNVFDAFREQFPTVDAVPDRIFLDVGRRITCAGSAGATDLALYLIARHCGSDKVQQCIRHMMLHEVRPSSYPQAHFYSDLLGVRDARVRRAVHLMEQALNEPISLDEIAAQIGTSARQLERSFRRELRQTPAGFYRDMRLRYGAWLIRHTELAMAQIASDAGFADGAHFARGFRQRFGTTPSRYRQTGPSEVRRPSGRDEVFHRR